MFCGRSVVFSGYSSFFHQYKWPPWYSWIIVESGVKHHKPTNQSIEKKMLIYIYIKNRYAFLDCLHLLYINVALLFFIVLFSEYPKLILNDSSHCNRTYNVTLVFRIHGSVKVFRFNPWKHVFNGIVIRSLDGFVDNRLGYLQISHCGYQDAGKYICSIWNSFSDGIYLTNKTTKLVVAGNLKINLEK